MIDLQSSMLNDNNLENYLPLTKYFHSQNRLMIQKYTSILIRRRNYAKKVKRAIRRQKVLRRKKLNMFQFYQASSIKVLKKRPE